MMHLPPGCLRSCAGACSLWASVAERSVERHFGAGEMLQAQLLMADAALEEFVTQLHAFLEEVGEEQTVPVLILRVHSSHCAAHCRTTQAQLRAVMTSGDGCDGLCAKVVQAAAVRRDVCAGILRYSLRKLGGSGSRLEEKRADVKRAKEELEEKRAERKCAELEEKRALEELESLRATTTTEGEGAAAAAGRGAAVQMP